MSKGFKTVFAWCGGLAAIVGILAWLGIRPSGGEPDSINQQGASSVASQNQSGGITANQVIVQSVVRPARKLGDSLKKELIRGLEQCGDRKVSVEVGTTDDREVMGFAEEVKAFLTESGYEVSGVGLTIGLISPGPLALFCEGDEPATVFIGARN